MTISMDKLCRIFARGLDVIEEEQIGASSYHSARVSALCAAMCRHMGYDDDAVSALAVCALFHDNALTEYNLSEADLKQQSTANMIRHCETGQNSVSWLPFAKDISGYILYHHELGDGRGPFGKKEGEYPFEAALLAAADAIDVKYRFSTVKPSQLPALRDEIYKNAGIYSTKKAVSALLDILTTDMTDSLHDDNINSTMDSALPAWFEEVSMSTVTSVADFFSHIIDYKSVFTRKHTTQIANRAWMMAGHYGFSPEERAAMYLAASLHDLGKLATPTEVLEKPGKLDPDEFNIIKLHVKHTHDWLCDMPDFELIRNWAADHHEKLDGTGYTFGKGAQDLDRGARLLACIDIYQAVCEARPYHDARTHEDTMPILRGMAEKGFIDGEIVRDLDEVMAEYSMRDVPAPQF